MEFKRKDIRRGPSIQGILNNYFEYVDYINFVRK